MTLISKNTFTLALLGSALAMPGVAQAQDVSKYVSISGGLTFQGDSDNKGELTSTFITGQGTTIPEGTPLPAGTELGWTTEFDTGLAINGAIGARYGNGFRTELELAYDKADVDTHEGVTAAGLDLTAEDAAVLTGSATPLGATVGAVVADGQGSLESIGVFLNAYYDIATDSPITPYVGAGIGWSQTEVDYSPSGVEIIDATDHGFAWQVMGGASYQVSEAVEVFAGVRYRAGADAEVDASLFPADFDIENKRVLGEVGLRFGF